MPTITTTPINDGEMFEAECMIDDLVVYCQQSSGGDGEPKDLRAALLLANAIRINMRLRPVSTLVMCGVGTWKLNTEGRHLNPFTCFKAVHYGEGVFLPVTMEAADRVEMVRKNMNPRWLELVLKMPGLQKSVRTAAERRLKYLSH